MRPELRSVSFSGFTGFRPKELIESDPLDTAPVLGVIRPEVERIAIEERLAEELRVAALVKNTHGFDMSEKLDRLAKRNDDLTKLVKAVEGREMDLFREAARANITEAKNQALKSQVAYLEQEVDRRASSESTIEGTMAAELEVAQGQVAMLSRTQRLEDFERTRIFNHGVQVGIAKKAEFVEARAAQPQISNFTAIKREMGNLGAKFKFNLQDRLDNLPMLVPVIAFNTIASVVGRVGSFVSNQANRLMDNIIRRIRI